MGKKSNRHRHDESDSSDSERKKRRKKKKSSSRDVESAADSDESSSRRPRKKKSSSNRREYYNTSAGEDTKERKRPKKDSRELDETSEERRERRRAKKERKEERARKREQKENRRRLREESENSNKRERSRSRRRSRDEEEESESRKGKSNNKKSSSGSRRRRGHDTDDDDPPKPSSASTATNSSIRQKQSTSEESERMAEIEQNDGSDHMIVEYKERSKAEIWCRRILCLPANPENETPIKKYLRILAWCTLLFDMTAAIVSLVTFGGITYCCGEPLLNMAADNVDWSIIVRSAIIVYLVLLILEIYPVVRQGFPFNIVNPIIGFIITFAVFFDDARTEALIMWALETMAVFCEFAIYRLKVYQVKKRAIEIKKLLPKTTRKVGDVYEDEQQAQADLRTARRKFYVLRKEQAKDQRMLRWLVFAVYLNFVLTTIVLIIILVISRSGGLCFINFQWPNPFRVDQIGECFMCSEPDLYCEVCTDAIKQCYFPYS